MYERRGKYPFDQSDDGRDVYDHGSGCFGFGPGIALIAFVVIVVLIGTMRYVRAGTPNDLVSACKQDAMAVCSWSALMKAAGGDYKGVSRCFVANKEKLSPVCRATLAHYRTK